MTGKTLTAGLAAAAIAVVAGVAIARRPHPSEVPAAPAKSSAAAAPSEMILTGRIQPATTVSVKAPMAGVLESFFVSPGDEVIQGQLLGKIHDSKSDTAQQQAQFALDQASTRVTNLSGEQLAAKLEVSRVSADQSRAHAEFDRVQKLYEKQKGLWAAGAIARLTYEKSEKDYNDAKAQVEKLDVDAKQTADRATQLQRDLDAANRAVTEMTAALDQSKAGANAGEIHSPADGIVIARHGDPGQPVDPAAEDLVQIGTDLTSLLVLVTPDAATLPRIQPGQAVMVKLGEDEIPGKVREIRGPEVVIEVTAPKPVTKLDVPVQVRIKF